MTVFHTRAIIEIAGSPKKFVEDTMDLLLKDMDDKEGMKVTKKDKAETKEFERVFSTFTEVEVEFKNMDALTQFCFDYLPSHIEIIDPDRIELRNEELQDFMQDILIRLHKTDMSLKDAIAEKQLHEDANKILIKNAISMALKDGPLPTSEISKATGIKEENLQAILDFYEENGLVEQKDKVYSLKKKLK